jgi:hypothetical protein
VDWTFEVHTPGVFTVVAETASEKDSAFRVSLADQSREVTIASSGSYRSFQPLAIGTFSIEQAGKQTISFQPVNASWNPVNLRSVSLTPVGQGSPSN